MRRLVPVVLLLLLWVPAAGAWTWPVNGPVLQGFSFDAAHPYAGGQHRGIDIGAGGGASVLAPASGVVSFAGSVPTSGRSVTIDTTDGLAVTLTHLGSISVAKGAAVTEGAVVATIGPSGTPEVVGPYVHLGVRNAASDQGYLDPLLFLPPLVPVVPVEAPAPAPAPVAAPADSAPPVAPPAAEPAPVVAPVPAAAADPSSPAVEPASVDAPPPVDAAPAADTAPIDPAPASTPVDVTPPATPVDGVPGAAPVETAPVAAPALAGSVDADPTGELPVEQPPAPAPVEQPPAPAAATVAEPAVPALPALAQPLAPAQPAAPSLVAVRPFAQAAPASPVLQRSRPPAHGAPSVAAPRSAGAHSATPARVVVAADLPRSDSAPAQRRPSSHRDAPAASAQALHSRVPVAPLAAALVAALTVAAAVAVRRRVPTPGPAPAADVLTFPATRVRDRERLAA